MSQLELPYVPWCPPWIHGRWWPAVYIYGMIMAMWQLELDNNNVLSCILFHCIQEGQVRVVGEGALHHCCMCIHGVIQCMFSHTLECVCVYLVVSGTIDNQDLNLCYCRRFYTLNVCRIEDDNNSHAHNETYIYTLIPTRNASYSVCGTIRICAPYR